MRKVTRHMGSTKYQRGNWSCTCRRTLLVEQNDSRCHRTCRFVSYILHIETMVDLTSTLISGFNYKFDALNSDPTLNELNSAFGTMFKTSTRMSIVPMLRAWFPPLRFLVRFYPGKCSKTHTNSQPADRDAEIKRSQQTMSRIGNQLLRDSKAANEKATEKSSWKARDLLSLLVRANMATDLPEHQRMSDEDVLDRK
jgi:hypothetical protein